MSSSSATSAQVNALLDFLAEHSELARGHLRSADGRRQAKRLWEQITEYLNSMGGCIKTVQQWQKVWTDKKHLTKKNAALARKDATGTGGGPPMATNLTSIEIRVLEIMGEGFGEPQTSANVQAFPNLNFDAEISEYSLGRPATSAAFSSEAPSTPASAVHSLAPATNTPITPTSPTPAAPTSPVVHPPHPVTPAPPSPESSESVVPLQNVEQATAPAQPTPHAGPATRPVRLQNRRPRIRSIRRVTSEESIQERLFRIEEEKLSLEREKINILVQIKNELAGIRGLLNQNTR